MNNKSLIISIIACVLALVAIVIGLIPAKESEAKDGLTPTIEISDDGYWIIYGVKTDVLLQASIDNQGLAFYLQDDGTYFVGTGNAKDLSSIEIPATYNGIAVTGITTNGFAGCENLSSITIPDSVTSIGGSAFFECSSLKNINYGGRMWQWREVESGKHWNYNTGNYTIYCTDGNIAK